MPETPAGSFWIHESPCSFSHVMWHRTSPPLYLTLTILNEPIYDYLIEKPNSSLMQYSLRLPQVKAALEDSQIDFAVTFSNIQSPNIIWEELLLDEISILAPISYKNQTNRSLELIDFKDCPFIFNSNSDDWFYLLVNLCHKAGFEPRIVFKGDEPTLVGSLIAQGIGVAMIPGFQQTASRHAPSQNSQTTFVRLKDPPRYSLGIAYMENHIPSMAACEFKERICNYLRRKNTI